MLDNLDLGCQSIVSLVLYFVFGTLAGVAIGGLIGAGLGSPASGAVLGGILGFLGIGGVNAITLPARAAKAKRLREWYRRL
jgi:hypothetical protein